MNRFKTITRNDPEFSSYLDGSFSKTHFAVPVRSLNIGSLGERVTFEIAANSQAPVVNPVHLALQLVRPKSLALSIGPMITLLFYCASHGIEVDRWVGATSFLGVVLFQISVNLFNDYGDHMKGQDRLRPYGGSRAIQRGLIRAMTVKKIAMLALIGAALLGLPAVFTSLGRALIIAVIALLAALEFAFQKLRLKYHGWGEIIAFLLTGPLLAVGYSVAISDKTTVGELLIGGFFGSISLLYLHSANFENIMVDEQVGARTWATRTGFDASKNFYYFCAILSFVFALVYVLAIDPVWPMGVPLLLLAGFLYRSCLRVSQLASPLSSRLTGLRGDAIHLCIFAAIGFSVFFCVLMGMGRG